MAVCEPFEVATGFLDMFIKLLNVSAELVMLSAGPSGRHMGCLYAPTQSPKMPAGRGVCPQGAKVCLQGPGGVYSALGCLHDT